MINNAFVVCSSRDMAVKKTIKGPETTLITMLHSESRSLIIYPLYFLLRSSTVFSGHVKITSMIG